MLTWAIQEQDGPVAIRYPRGEAYEGLEGFREKIVYGKAEVLYKKDENGKLLEPMELAYIDVPDEFTGTVIEKLGQRKGDLLEMNPMGS